MGQIQPKKQEIKHTEAYNDIINSIKINNYNIKHRTELNNNLT